MAIHIGVVSHFLYFHSKASCQNVAKKFSNFQVNNRELFMKEPAEKSLKEIHIVQCSLFLITKTLSFKLTSALPMTCYVGVLWPELWLQCQSVDCL